MQTQILVQNASTAIIYFKRVAYRRVLICFTETQQLLHVYHALQTVAFVMPVDAGHVSNLFCFTQIRLFALLLALLILFTEV